MRKILYSLFCLVALLTSCSEIGEDERFTFVDSGSLSVQRNVLLEDFTGQKCSNCPAATREVAKLQEMFGAEHVIAVAIHGGPLAVNSKGSTVGLRNTLADEYYNTFRIPDNPKGVVNRNSGVLAPNGWLAAVSKEIQQTATVDLAIDATCTDDATLDVTITATAKQGAVDGKLQVWVLEDGIVATQQVLRDDQTVENDRNYVHNHVLRAAMNGAWGEEISLAQAETKQQFYTLPVDEAWDATHLSIVAFVYNDSGVQQVMKAEVK